jgi:cystathionine beta-lyase/cystathionine gamma-synthase
MRFIDALEIPFIATSLGGCESLVQQPAVMSFWYVTLRFRIVSDCNLQDAACCVHDGIFDLHHGFLFSSGARVTRRRARMGSRIT